VTFRHDARTRTSAIGQELPGAWSDADVCLSAFAVVGSCSDEWPVSSRLLTLRPVAVWVAAFSGQGRHATQSGLSV